MIDMDLIQTIKTFPIESAFIVVAVSFGATMFALSLSDLVFAIINVIRSRK